MTSLLGRLLPLFTGTRRVEDLFTEAVARLFERRPQLCLSWLDSLGLITPDTEEGRRYVSVVTQRSFLALDEHDSRSRPDLLLEVHRASEDADPESTAEVVMIESKIGSVEGQHQLRRYAGHLRQMAGTRKTLVYITRAYDPKDETEVLADLDGKVGFKQLRWHDFYRFLRRVEKDALVEEVLAFMEEQGMARTYRFSTTDLMALSKVPRSFELFDETLRGEVMTELESFAGNKLMREARSLDEIRHHQRYSVRAPLHGWDLFCDAGYQLGRVDDSTHASILRIATDGYPAIFVFLEARPGAEGRDTSVAAMERIALNAGWEPYNLDNPSGWAGVRRVSNLASLLSEEDHVAATKRFFVQSIHQLRDELTVFKQDHPNLLYSGT